MNANPTPKIRVLRAVNPKKPGTKAWHRFNLYKDGMTTNEFLRSGGTRSDLQYDTDHGYIEITTFENKADGSNVDSKADSNRHAALRRIKALAAKTIGNGCTEQEAFAAAEMMGKLMDRYGIESSDLEIQAEVCIVGVHGADRLQMHASSKICAVTVAKYCDVRVWHKTGTGIISFFGLPADVEVATYLMRVIEGAMNRSLKEFKKDPSYPSYDPARHVRNTFLSSMGGRINARLMEMYKERHTEAQVTTTGTSLVVVKNAVVTEQFAKLGMRLGKGKATTTAYSASSAAMAAGAAAGNKVHLGTAIGGGAQAKRIG